MKSKANRVTVGDKTVTAWLVMIAIAFGTNRQPEKTSNFLGRKVA